MLIAHLMFAHMLADYALQTNWLVARKSEGYLGLALHGGMVGFMSLLAVSPYLGHTWLPLIALTGLHTVQDYLKVRYGPRLKLHPFYPYMGDQIGHYLTIGTFQLWIGSSLNPAPGDIETAFMWCGALGIAVTRCYDVTWWANWLDMIPYMNRWRALGYAERLAMLALAAAGLWVVAPVCVIPRLALSASEGKPVWKQRRGALEMGLGIILSIALGWSLRMGLN